MLYQLKSDISYSTSNPTIILVKYYNSDCIWILKSHIDLNIFYAAQTLCHVELFLLLS